MILLQIFGGKSTIVSPLGTTELKVAERGNRMEMYTGNTTSNFYLEVELQKSLAVQRKCQAFLSREFGENARAFVPWKRTLSF